MKQLPQGWINCHLFEISEVVTGKTPSKKNDEYFNGAIPFIKPGDVRNQGVIESTEETLTEIGADMVTCIPPDSITVTCIGNLGRAAITKVLSTTNQQINSVIPNENISTKFLYYYLRTIKNWMESEASSTTVTIINKGRFLKAPVILPPVNEQIRIADKLDSMLAKVDAAQARLEKIPTLLKRFRQSVLAAATSGELTREWRAENKIDATYTTLGEAGIEVKTGPFGSALHKEEYVSDGIPVINPMHIRDGSIYPTAEMTITKDKFKELKAWKLEVGDVVIGRRGEMGRAAEITSYDADLLCGTGSMIIRSNTGLISSAYLCLVLRSPNSVAYFESNSVGSTMVNLNQKIIKNLNFHYPSSEEQKEIVRRVESLFTLADTVEKQYLETKKRIDRLTQSLLAKAFRGELVPQDTNDEPAAEFLKRIQAERNAQPPVKNKRSKPA